ncbi:MAG: DUF348 domain-containing protein [Anaerolineae bacterium]|nr:DUF348 domain-containing protein [Anaerolineae bacterium]
MTNQRLPLPGEQPLSIWRPRQKKVRRPNKVMVVIAGGLAILAVGLWLWRATALPVTVVVNGKPVALRTHRRTVAGAAVAAGAPVDDTVYLAPPAETPLQPGMVITVGFLRPVIIHADGQVFIAKTRSIQPEAIAAEVGIVLEESDAIHIDRAARPTSVEIQVNPALADVPVLPREISIIRARTVIVSEGGSRVSFQTSANTVGEALLMAGYALYEADRISPSTGSSIPAEGLEISIERAAPVTVLADAHWRIVRSFQPTVGSLLRDLDLALTGRDYVLPDIDAPLPDDGQIRLVRVREETLIEKIPLPFQTTTVPDPDLELDQLREAQPGVDGVLARQVQIRYEDGIEVSRVVTGEWTDKLPQARVVAYGTQLVISEVRTERGDLKYWRKLHVLATSYSPSTAGDKKPGDARFGLSGTGAPVTRGVVATDPRIIPLGTHLYVPGYGLGRALDVGGAVKGMRIDLGYTDDELTLWNTWVDVYLLLPLPLPDEMIWVFPEEFRF